LWGKRISQYIALNWLEDKWNPNKIRKRSKWKCFEGMLLGSFRRKARKWFGFNFNTNKIVDFIVDIHSHYKGHNIECNETDNVF
jgi:hypothetical protein